MKKAIYNLYFWGIGLLIIGCATLIPSANYLFYGNTTNLNEFMAGKNLASAELPEKEMVTLKINKCYGNFADRICVSLPNSLKLFPKKKRTWIYSRASLYLSN